MCSLYCFMAGLCFMCTESVLTICPARQVFCAPSLHGSVRHTWILTQTLQYYIHYPCLHFCFYLLCLHKSLVICGCFKSFGTLCDRHFMVLWHSKVITPANVEMKLRVCAIDFYVADQLTTLTIFLVDVEFASCYVLSGSFYDSDATDDHYCIGHNNSAKPYIAIIPSWWRMMQCFRKYKPKRFLSVSMASLQVQGLMQNKRRELLASDEEWGHQQSVECSQVSAITLKRSDAEMMWFLDTGVPFLS